MVKKRMGTFSYNHNYKTQWLTARQGRGILQAQTHFNNAFMQGDVHSTLFKGTMPAE